MKKNKNLKEQLHIAPIRRNTWIGIRPTVFQSKKHNPKRDRREGKTTCRQYCC